MEDYLNELLEVLNPENTAVYNRKLAKNIGVTEAIIYQALIAKYKYYHDKKQLTDGYFFSTITDLAESTCFTEKQQRAAIKKLVSLRLISQKIMNMPAKRYFKINNDVELILKYLSSDKRAEPVPTKGQNQFRQKGRTSSDKRAEPVPTKGQTKLNNNLNHNLNNLIYQSNEIDRFIQDTKERFKIELSRKQVIRWMEVKDLNTIYSVIDYVVTFAKSNRIKIKDFTAYITKTLQTLESKIEFDGEQAVKDDHQRQHELNERLKEQVRSSYKRPEYSPNGICAQIHREYTNDLKRRCQ